VRWIDGERAESVLGWQTTKKGVRRAKIDGDRKRRETQA
jgi:hypothetical protein